MDDDDTRRLVPHAGRCCDLEDGEAATEIAAWLLGGDKPGDIGV
jgi:hypothetical protein